MRPFSGAVSITDFERKPEMLEYVLLAVLLLAALFIIIAVVFQKSSDEGLSSTIAGGNETFLGREKKGGADKLWFKWTVIAAIVFAVCCRCIRNSARLHLFQCG